MQAMNGKTWMAVLVLSGLCLIGCPLAAETVTDISAPETLFDTAEVEPAFDVDDLELVQVTESRWNRWKDRRDNDEKSDDEKDDGKESEDSDDDSSEGCGCSKGAKPSNPWGRP